MSHEVKREYLNAIRERYKNSSKSKKSLILDEFCAVCKYDRKYAIAILNGHIEPKNHVYKGKTTLYGPDVIFHLVRLWRAMGQPGSTKFKAALPEWISYDTVLSNELEVKEKVLTISRAQIDRVLRHYRLETNKGISSTRGGPKRIKYQIPIQPKDWNITEPGQLVQADTVAHCGDTLLGMYANSLTITDLETTWTENRALWGKNSKAVINAMTDIENTLPFQLQGFKSDSGSEFMNYELIAYFKERANNPVNMTRSRPYKKDDNCYVEQKNFTHVRELFGYVRIEDEDLVQLMNEIYKNYWCPLQNFFIPSQKLLRKTRIGSKIKKEYEAATTPYERVLRSKFISDEQKEALRVRKSSMNPFELQKGLKQKLTEFEEILRKRSAGLLAA